MTMEAEATFKKRIEHKEWASKDWSRFWAEAKALGFDKTAVHAHFGLESMKNFNGSVDDALALLATPRMDLGDEQEPEPDDFPPEDEDYQPEPPQRDEPAADSEALFRYSCQLPTSPVWAATEFIDEAGFKWKVSIQSGLPNEMLIESLSSVRELMMVFSKGARHYKWIPATFNDNGNGRKPQAAAAQAQASDEPPVCNLHNRPMKRSKHFNGWYCTVKLADGSYCKEKVEDE